MTKKTIQFDWAAVVQACQKPPRFAPGEPHFWDDPHIAQQMLKFHLNPDVEAASRQPATIDAIVDWIIKTLELQPGDALLDLGCGPGLYCQRFSARGLDVTGVDLSENSLNYARQHDEQTTYIRQNYLELDMAGAFKAITLIYGDFCVPPDDARDQLLAKIHSLLEPGGAFVFDVTTFHQHDYAGRQPTYDIAPEGGFWKPTPHITLSQWYTYPEQDTALDQYVVIEANGTTSVYRNWFHYYSGETITALLEANGFKVEGLYGDLTGAPFSDENNWIGIVARKV